MYVGQTSRSLRKRFIEHRYNIKNKKDCPVADHFNNICKNINYLRLIPVEHVPKPIEGPLRNEDTIELLKREQFWIKKLKTQSPFGMNHRNDVPPPIPFCLKHMDNSYEITKVVKQFHSNIQNDQFKTFKNHFLTIATKRNKNLKDYLVSSIVKLGPSEKNY